MENYRSGKTHPVKKIGLDPYYAIHTKIVYAENFIELPFSSEITKTALPKF
jgi:hypothetical protein